MTDESQARIVRCRNCGAPANEFIERNELRLENPREGRDEDSGTADVVYCGLCGTLVDVRNLPTE